MVERTTVRLPEALLRRAKRKAAAEGQTLTALIVHGLELAIGEDRKTSRPKRVVPRVSRATGGLAPGVDLTSFSALQEAEDLEAIRRPTRIG